MLGVAIVLTTAFLAVHFIKSIHEKRVENVTNELASAPPLVNTVTAGKAPATLTLKLPGETAAWYESTLYARVDGYVAQWNVDIGDKVKKGQVLATIETPELDAQLASAQARLKAAGDLVESRKADADFAKTTYARWRDSPHGVVSEQEREAKKAGFESAVARLNEAQAQVTLDKADVDHYTALTEFKQVVAPYDGTITKRRIDIGNLVTAGSSANTTPLYKIAQNNPMRVFIDVPQRDAGDMKVGVTARITASNIPGRVFEGRIARTAEAIDPQARTLTTEVDLPNPDLALVPGMFVDVSFDIPTEGWIQIPASALIFRSSGPEVAVIDKERHVAYRKVSIARDNGNAVQIGSGLTEGDQVALNISKQIREGETVEPVELKDGAANVSTPKQ